MILNPRITSNEKREIKKALKELSEITIRHDYADIQTVIQTKRLKKKEAKNWGADMIILVKCKQGHIECSKALRSLEELGAI